MKKTVLILLALCLVVFMTGCDDSSSSNSFGLDNGSGTKFVVTDLVDHTGVTDLKVIKGKGIEFKEMGTAAKIYKTMTLNSNKKFTASYDVVLGGLPEQKFSASGTWSQSGSTITLKYSSGTETATLSSDGKTLTDTALEPNLHTYLVYTKQ
jgi:hypothetical protein